MPGMVCSFAEASAAGQRGEPFQRGGGAQRAHDGRRTLRPHAGLVPFPGRDAQPLLGRGLHQQVRRSDGAGAGGRRAVAVHQVAVAAPGLDHGDLLLQDRGHEGVDQAAGGGQPHGGVPASGLNNHPGEGGVERGLVKGGPVVVAAQHPRRGSGGIGGTGPPGLDLDGGIGRRRTVRRISNSQPERGGTRRRRERHPEAVRCGADGRIAVPPQERAEGPGQVEGTARVPPQRGVSRGGNAGGDVCNGHPTMIPRTPDSSRHGPSQAGAGGPLTPGLGGTRLRLWRGAHHACLEARIPVLRRV